jgi:hypothetical protein
MLQSIDFISSILINSFLLGTLLNFALSKRVFKVEFKRVQNWLGITLVVGLILSYGLFVLEHLFDVDYGQRKTMRPISEYSSWYLFLCFYPLLFLALNLFTKLRQNKIVSLTTLLVFYPRMMEFIVIYTITDCSFSDLNHAYTDPIRQILIAGPVLYVTIVLVERYVFKSMSKNE